METKSKTQNECAIHKDSIKNCVCFDTECLKDCLICIGCIKDEHVSCKNTLLVHKNDINKTISLQTSKNKNEDLIQEVQKLLDKHRANLNKQLDTRDKEFLDSLRDIKDFDEFQDSKRMKSIKEYYSVAFEAENKKILMTSKLDQDKETRQNNLSILEEYMNNITTKYTGLYEQMKFPLNQKSISNHEVMRELTPDSIYKD